MLLAKNRRALYDYEIIEKYLAGIDLRGFEVKAVRERKVNFEGSYVQVVGDEVVLVNLHIGRYSKQSQDVPDDDTRRTRRLLLTKREIEQIKRELQQKGKTAVPLALVLRNNMVKLEFAVVKGRKQRSKKQLEKERQIRKDMEKEVKEFRRSDYMV